ncbi:MAG: GNAT family N-acetyltransferase [Streptosporangiaceae bacterium]|jgi:RimJ/RimL family protein N-acetyltransferase
MIYRGIVDQSEIDLLVSRHAKREVSARWVAGLLERGESRPEWCRMALSDDGELLAAHAMDSWSIDRDPGETPTFVHLLGHVDEAAAVALLDHDLRAFDEDDLVEVFAAVTDGSVDHSMIIGRAEHGRREEAAIRLGQARRRKHEDDWFVVGVDGAGVPVGYVQSALDVDDGGFLAEIGVVESQRGHRYVDELLAYGTGVLADRGETQIRSHTDAANHAMRAAFARGGYAETGSRRDFRRVPR